MLWCGSRPISRSIYLFSSAFKMGIESYRRFYSHWLHVIWLYRLVGITDVRMNTAVLFLYGIMGGCDYANSMYPVWHNRLHAVGEEKSVADTFSLYEFVVSYISSVTAAYWLLDTLVPSYVWCIFLVLSWVGHVVLGKLWMRRISKLRHTTYRHVPI